MVNKDGKGEGSVSEINGKGCKFGPKRWKLKYGTRFQEIVLNFWRSGGALCLIQIRENFIIVAVDVKILPKLC